MSLLLPVRYPAKLYSHSDAGAPKLDNIDGAIKTILKGCLVTGYGTKASAGWTSLFEDGNRIIVRPPESAHGIPDLKIENGGSKYRIVSQDNPIGLDDTTEITSVPLLSKDGATNKEWYLIATDIGFVFCYHMAEQGYANASNRYSVLYCALMQNLDGSQGGMPFVITNQSTVSASTGISTPWLSSMLDGNARYKNMRTGALYSVASFLSLPVNAIGRVMHKYLVSVYTPVVFASVFAFEPASTGVVVESDGRQMLAYSNNVQQSGITTVSRVIFIPVDYWEV